MKIFISWSGERSQALAKALHEWLPIVLQFVDPWLSHTDIPAGQRWIVEIGKALDECNFGIICLTRENLQSPQILFEAGALAKSMNNSSVVPLLLDMDLKDLNPPLSQFQAKKADKEGLKQLVHDINDASSTPVVKNTLETLISALMERIEKPISLIDKTNAPAKHKRPDAEVLEELVAGVRNLDMRIREISDDSNNLNRLRRKRISPKLVYEMIHQLYISPQDPTRILILASLFRDEAPWVSELGMEAYRAITTGQQYKLPLIRFKKSIDIIINSPLADVLGIDRMMMKMLHNEFMDFDDFINVTDLA